MGLGGKRLVGLINSSSMTPTLALAPMLAPLVTTLATAATAGPLSFPVSGPVSSSSPSRRGLGMGRAELLGPRKELFPHLSTQVAIGMGPESIRCPRPWVT